MSVVGMNSYGKLKSRQVSAGRSESGRYLEPSQLFLQATGSAVADRQQTRSAVDFRITKDSGLVKSVDLGATVNALPTHKKFAPTGETQTIVGFEGGSNFRVSNSKADSENDPVEDGRHSRSNSITNQSQQYLPGDRVIFAESPHSPGALIVYRPPEERAANPDRLNLDRRKLTVCPVLDGEEQLRLLNYQHNFIRRIANLHGLRRLIFLDLYDNQVEEISGLGTLKSLRVLMLGKNRIKKIENLDALTKLDVLDLHGNEIRVIENLNHLSELRVLNLAGNKIVCVENLDGLDALTELNLRRNSIRQVVDLDLLPNLQRLFLSFNEITTFDDVACLASCVSLVEIAFDGNPLANDPAYKQIILRNMATLKQLDMKRIMDEERRIANIMARKEEDKRKEFNKMAIMKERRRLAIDNAKRQWEVMQSALMGKTNRIVTGMPELYAVHTGSYPNPSVVTAATESGQQNIAYGDADDSAMGGTDEMQDLMQTKLRPQSADVAPSSDAISAVRDSQRRLERMMPKQRSRSESRPGVNRSGNDTSGASATTMPSPRKADGPGYHAEIEGETLTFYGSGSLEYLDKNWGVQAAGSVTTITFKFIDFQEIVSKAFVKIRSRFPAVHTLIFTANNLHSLSQINGLAQARRVDHLTIESEGNLLPSMVTWKSYVLYRLSHFSLKTLNGQEVLPADVLLAERLFGHLGKSVSLLPTFRMVSLIGDLSHRKKLLNASTTSDKLKSVGGGSSSSSSSSAVDLRAALLGQEAYAKMALAYQLSGSVAAKSQELASRHTVANQTVVSLAREAVAAHKNHVAIDRIWPTLFGDLVARVAVEMADVDLHAKRSMDQFAAGELLAPTAVAGGT